MKLLRLPRKFPDIQDRFEFTCRMCGKEIDFTDDNNLAGDIYKCLQRNENMDCICYECWENENTHMRFLCNTKKWKNANEDIVYVDKK